MRSKYIVSIIVGLMLVGFGTLNLVKNITLAAVPTDFQTTQIIGTGLNGPTGFAFAPDGRIFILERTGAIKIYKNGQLLVTPFATLPSEDTGDRGLVGIAFDPNYASNFYVYFYYTGTDLFNHLVRFDASADVGQNGPFEIFRTNQPSELLHIGGTIAFGPDGKLYISVGDNGIAQNAQDLSIPYGKVLRINKDGTIPSDNPFVGQSGKLPQIWAYGFRNPFRFSFDSATGKLYLGDVGSDSWEEMNLVTKGGNYGWPNAEGNCTLSCTSYIDPIYTYPHAGGASFAIAGGPVYRGSMFPASYQGSLFFGDYAGGFLKRLVLDAGGNTVQSAQDFDIQAGSVVDSKVAADGSLYYITYYPGRLYRVSYSTTSSIPTANASADVTKGLAPLTVNFSSAGTTDPDNDPLTYLWDFGDGTSSTQANPVKVYNTEGTYTVELTVRDGTHTANAIPIIIQVGIAPTVIIASPADGSTYKAGDIINYAASGQDGAGRDLPDSAFTTEVRFHHLTHFHPFLGPLTNTQNGFFQIPITGETSPVVWYEILITATDTHGLSTTKTVNIYPIESTMTFNTSPANLTYYLDGIPHNSSYTTDGVVGLQRELNTTFSQIQGGTPYQFVGWSDGGTINHNISTPATPHTYTANFVAGQTYHANFYSNINLTGSPVFTHDYPSIDFLWNGGSPDVTVPNDSFSARLTKTDDFIAGTYRFTVTADDGVRVYVDNELIINKWVDAAPTTYTADLGLTAGSHDVRVEYYEHFGGATLQFSYDYLSASLPPPASGFTASYWNTPAAGSAPVIPSTAPTLTRLDSDINFDWGGSSPDPLINNDHFVARWTKTDTFAAGNYEFSITGDDGVRLYIDNVLTIDNWVDQGPTTTKVIKTLTAGSHDIKMEYYENAGGALAKLSYVSTVTAPPAVYTASYWNTPTAGTAPVIPATAADLTRTDSDINFDWGNSTPGAPINSDHFVARWTKTDAFAAGNYQFSVTADDGVRLYIDNVLVINKWVDQGPTTDTVIKTLTAGNHDIKMEYYENAGGATAKFSYTTSATPPPAVYAASYWNTPGAGSAPAIPVTAPTLTRTDSDINFNWAGSSPDPLINNDHFVARWTKTDSFTAGNYEFSITGDDGVRLYIDNVLVVNNWVDQGPTTTKVIKTLAAGNHDIKMEYYENAGGAVAKLSYAASTTPPPASFNAEYFDNMTLTGVPKLTRVDANINFNWGNGSPDPLIPSDNFSARWTKQDTYVAGPHTFTLTSDDGIRLKVDGTVVFERWTDHGPTVDAIGVPLTAGVHTIVVEYYEKNGGAVAMLSE